MRSASSMMIVIGQVLADPWLSITRSGQFPTWLVDAADMGIRVRHSHGWRPTAITRRLDRVHEWARWTGRGRTLIPKVDARVGRPWLRRVPRVRAGTFISEDSIAWQQSLLDVYALQRWKIVGSFSQALQEDFSHVYFTTASSYVRPYGLLRAISEMPESNVYAGTPHVDAISGVSFASGANRVFSRDVIEAVVRDRQRYRNDVMEDVGLGRLISEMGIEMVPLPSLNVSSAEVLASLSDEEILGNFHYRMTSGSKNDRHDAELMRQLHTRVLTLEIESGIRDA